MDTTEFQNIRQPYCKKPNIQNKLILFFIVFVLTDLKHDTNMYIRIINNGPLTSIPHAHD